MWLHKSELLKSLRRSVPRRPQRNTVKIKITFCIERILMLTLHIIKRRIAKTDFPFFPHSPLAHFSCLVSCDSDTSHLLISRYVCSWLRSQFCLQTWPACCRVRNWNTNPTDKVAILWYVLEPSIQMFNLFQSTWATLALGGTKSVRLKTLISTKSISIAKPTFSKGTIWAILHWQ